MADAKVSGKGNRPIGITLLAVLEILGAIVLLGLGAMFTFGGGAIAAATGTLSSVVGPVIGVVGIVFLVLGIAELVVAYGFLKGMAWSWWIEVVLTALGLIIMVFSLVRGNVSSIISIIIGALVLYYMTRPEAKKWFGV
jgi:hypothetical protein